jgi:hypothetical protein
MSNTSKTFNDYIVSGILIGNQYNITVVQNLESVRSMYFKRETYPEIKEIIRKGDLAALDNVPDAKSEFAEYLEVMTFDDQDGRKYAITVYDSIDLWQDPQIIDIFLMK